MKGAYFPGKIISILIFTSTFLQAQEIPLQQNPATDQCNNIRLYLMQAAAEITDHELDGINTLQDWQKVRNERYGELVEMLGLEDRPLNAKREAPPCKVTGVLKEKGYHIEKLYYESMPHLYVAANLYIPDHIRKPRPAILYVCGHSPTQKVHYQAHARKFAQLGFVCLIIETIQWGEVRGEHWGAWARGWFNWYSRGYDPGGVEAWNGIRGLDLLASRKEVDPDRMGVTGISGGGSQTWYIAALDPRIKAAAPVCGASTLKYHIMTRTIDGHCDCMMPVNTYRRDFGTIGALVAPRPFLIAQADRDGLNAIESVRELYHNVKNIYSLYDVPQNISLVETPGGHSYHRISRERIFSFFLKHLMGKDISPEKAGDIDTIPGDQLTEEELKVYVNGPPPDDLTTKIQDSFVRLATPPELSGKQQLIPYRDSVIRFLRRETFGAFPEKELPFDPRLVFRTADRATYGSDIYSFVSEKGWRLKVDIRWNRDPQTKGPLMIVLRNPDEERWSSESFAGKISYEGNVAFLEVRGVGENGWDPSLQWHIRRASAWTGRTIASMQVYDLLRCITFCRTLESVDPEKITIAARGEMSVVALYAALLDGKCAGVVVKDPPESQDLPSRPDGRGPATEMLNCLRVTDVNQLPALIWPAKTEFIGTPPQSYTWAEETLKKISGEK